MKAGSFGSGSGASFWSGTNGVCHSQSWTPDWPQSASSSVTRTTNHLKLVWPFTKTQPLCNEAVKSVSAQRVFERLYADADALNRRNILELIGPGPHTSLCDLGCDDGSWTVELAAACGRPKTYGVEIIASRAEIARSRGIEVVVSDLA